MSILFDFKEYIKNYFGVNARYKAINPNRTDDDEYYQEQNIIIIYPQQIKYGSNDSENGKIAIRLYGELAIYITEEKMKENFLFEKYFRYGRDTQLELEDEFNITHANEELLEVSVGFIWLANAEFDKPTKKIDNIEKIYITKKDVPNEL